MNFVLKPGSESPRTGLPFDPPTKIGDVVWATIAVTNSGAFDGTVQSVGVQYNPYSTRDIDWNLVEFPKRVPAGQTLVFLVQLGWIGGADWGSPIVHMTDEALLRKIRGVVSGWEMPGIGVSLWRPVATLISSRGTMREVEPKVPVGALFRVLRERTPYCPPAFAPSLATRELVEGFIHRSNRREAFLKPATFDVDMAMALSVPPEMKPELSILGRPMEEVIEEYRKACAVASDAYYP